MRFVPQMSQSRLPFFPVVSFLADPDGSLWIGTETGLIHRKEWRMDHTSRYAGRVNSISSRPANGSIWVIADAAACWSETSSVEVEDTKTECYGEHGGSLSSRRRSSRRRSASGLWAGTDTSVLQLESGLI